MNFNNSGNRNVWETTPPMAWKRFVAGKTIPNNNYTPNYYQRPSSFNRPQYYSAGVLPYARDAGGNMVFLLGKDKEGNWSDFGGRSEQQDGGNHVKTAVRELYEETMGSVMTIDSAQRMLSQPTHSNKRSVINSTTLGGSPYYMFTLEIQYADYKKNFKRTYEYLKYLGHNKFIEKVDIRWVSVETLLAAVDRELQNTNVLVPLRPIFKSTITDHIEEIKTIEKNFQQNHL
tara:strand:+ start:609 stop:1301 length:693 start_codon:yes stop_codon:yes gene_type:complete